eukprot:CAMPEP_0198702070 /NCGR_PEP_ID=MMETSP1468-20131203/388556_1 /TAXON_ID=1461545 /ORGANISM="Mantoniella sp, Strain CCMP1436" /LENGTH=136 /DNA_ID=CAMNT_0044460557 /DNA_START=1512 /DNA_END=1923 /DNA_ORIENTATION=-
MYSHPSGGGSGGNNGSRVGGDEAADNSNAAPPASSTSSFSPLDPSTPPFSSRALQGWLLLCCQLPNSGLQDKPGKGRDHYHTCYCLSGLSTAQHWGRDGLVGPEENLLERTNPLVNVTEERYLKWMAMVAAAGSEP